MRTNKRDATPEDGKEEDIEDCPSQDPAKSKQFIKKRGFKKPVCKNDVDQEMSDANESIPVKPVVEMLPDTGSFEID